MELDTHTRAKSSRLKDYLDRNSRWLSPVIGAAIAVMSAELAASLFDDPGQPAPAPAVHLAVQVALVLANVGSLIALGIAGVFARLCDTISARIFTIVLVVGAIALVVLLLRRYVGW